MFSLVKFNKNGLILLPTATTNWLWNYFFKTMPRIACILVSYFPLKVNGEANTRINVNDRCLFQSAKYSAKIHHTIFKMHGQTVQYVFLNLVKNISKKFFLPTEINETISELLHAFLWVCLSLPTDGSSAVQNQFLCWVHLLLFNFSGRFSKRCTWINSKPSKTNVKI